MVHSEAGSGSGNGEELGSFDLEVSNEGLKAVIREVAESLVKAGDLVDIPGAEPTSSAFYQSNVLTASARTAVRVLDGVLPLPDNGSWQSFVEQDIVGIREQTPLTEQ